MGTGVRPHACTLTVWNEVATPRDPTKNLAGNWGFWGCLIGGFQWETEKNCPTLRVGQLFSVYPSLRRDISGGWALLNEVGLGRAPSLLSLDSEVKVRSNASKSSKSFLEKYSVHFSKFSRKDFNVHPLFTGLIRLYQKFVTPWELVIGTVTWYNCLGNCCNTSFLHDFLLQTLPNIEILIL